METDLMTSVISIVRPEGLPPEESLAYMQQSEKELLYEQQRQIIQIFREKANERVASLQDEVNRLQSLQPRSETITRSAEIIRPKLLMKPIVQSKRPQRCPVSQPRDFPTEIPTIYEDPHPPAIPIRYSDMISRPRFRN